MAEIKQYYENYWMRDNDIPTMMLPYPNGKEEKDLKKK